VSAAEGHVAEIVDAVVDDGAAVAIFAVIEKARSGVADDLNGGDVVSEMAGQRGQTVTGADAEVVSAIRPLGEEAGSGIGVGALVPGRVPLVALSLVPVGIGRWGGWRFLRDGGEGKSSQD
jgi:hypothetical protein